MRTVTMEVGGPTNVATFGGSGPTFVLVHGLGGSHVNWIRLGPLLSARGRVLAPDLPGFGRTPPHGRDAGVSANARWLARFLREVVGEPAILVGNSMGGLISLLTGALSPERVAGLLLLDPALPLAPREPRDVQVTLAFAAYLTPGVGESFVRSRARRLGPEGLVRETFRLCCVDPSRVPPDVIRAHVEMSRARLRMPWADPSVLRAARTMVRMLLRRQRFRALLRRVRPPTLLVTGADDRLVTLAAARVAADVRPDWIFRALDDVGHVPQLEAPGRVMDAIDAWLEHAGREALARAERVADRRDPRAAPA